MIETIIKTIAQIGFIIFIIVSLFHWVRTGFWVPKYVHFIAIASLVVGGFLYYTARSLGDADLTLYIYLIIGFPVAVYLIYGVYGGGVNSKDIIVNDDFLLDRGMLKDEVIEIMKENFSPYMKWSYENLLLLSANEHRTEIKGKSGREYIFEVSSETFEDGDISEGEPILTVYGILTEYKRKFYKPRSNIVFEVGRDGTMYRDGLKMNT